MEEVYIILKRLLILQLQDYFKDSKVILLKFWKIILSSKYQKNSSSVRNMQRYTKYSKRSTRYNI